ncbi:MAG: hypothetical protein SPM02_08700 [Bacteroidales bacterium]|nr:hypothetical protein [Bacteroidales bacterium]
MKKMYILALVAATMAFSCNKNVVEQAPVQEPVLRTFTCTIAEPDTKLAIDDANGKTTWEVGDEILIHGKATSENVTVTLTSTDISADAKTATFSVALPATAYDPDGYYAAYPADAYIEYSSDRGYYYNTFDETNLPLMSAYLSGDSFLFFNLCGAISFVVDGDYDQYVFSGNNGETVGYDRYNVKILSNDKNYCRVSGTEGTVGEKTSITASVVADGTTVNRVFFPNGASFAGGFTIKFLKGGSIVKTLSTTSSVSVPRNSYRPMGDVTAYLKDYVAPTTHNNTIGVTVASATDLGSTATANCYIVSSAGDYKFKAVKGNSSTVVGTVASVAILWETWNNAETVTANSVIAAADYDLQSGGDPYVVFKTPATLHVGNALIAAKDALGNILWSWHIWVPATYPTSATFGIHDTKEMMDRNLGALDIPSKDAAVPANAGFFYQWGRKDPLRTISAFDTGALATTYPANVWTTSSTQLTTENMEASPCVFVTGNTDWLSTRENTLWDETKQIHDPCPVGYKVPKYGFTSFFDYFTIANYAGWSFNDANYNFTIGKTTDPVAVFPFGHITRYGSYDLSDSKAWVWTATYKSDNAENARAVTVASESSSSCTGQRKANGVYVRCVAE